MIDPRRWILAETWLALGLRVEWQDDDEERLRFIYDGNRVWKVLDTRHGNSTGGPYTAPSFGTATLTHELAHYLSATPEQRMLRNFGADGTTEDDALATEQILDAIIGAAARIASLALKAPR